MTLRCEYIASVSARALATAQHSIDIIQIIARQHTHSSLTHHCASHTTFVTASPSLTVRIIGPNDHPNTPAVHSNPLESEHDGQRRLQAGAARAEKR